MTTGEVVLRNQGKEGLHLHKVASLVRIAREIVPGERVRVSTPFGAEDVRHHLRITGSEDVEVTTEHLLHDGARSLVIVFDLPAGRPFNWDDRDLAEAFVDQMEDLARLAGTSRLWIHLSDAHRFLPWRFGLRRSDRVVLGRRPLVINAPSRAYLRARAGFWRAVRSASLVLVETAAQMRWMRSMGLPVALFPGRLSDEAVPVGDGAADGRHPIVGRARALSEEGRTLIGVTGRALKGKKGTLGVVTAALRAAPDLRFVLLGSEPVALDVPPGSVLFAGAARLGERDYLDVLGSCDLLLNVPGPDHPLLHGTGSLSDAIAVRRPLVTAPHLIDDELLGFASAEGWDRDPLAPGSIATAVARGRTFDWSSWAARAAAGRLLGSERRRSDGTSA